MSVYPLPGDPTNSAIRTEPKGGATNANRFNVDGNYASGGKPGVLVHLGQECGHKSSSFWG